MTIGAFKMWVIFKRLNGPNSVEHEVKIGPFNIIRVGRISLTVDNEAIAAYDDGWFYNDEWFHCFEVLF